MTGGFSLDYVVLRCADLERSRTFEEALGLELIAEQHGTGVRHYAFTIGAVVFELYPLVGRPTAGLRLGLRLADVGAAIKAMEAVGAAVVRVAPPGRAPSAVIRDPDWASLG